MKAGDEYSGYRISLTAKYPSMTVPLKLDFITGDKIRPREIAYDVYVLCELQGKNIRRNYGFN